jgi:hypothetical protein
VCFVAAAGSAVLAVAVPARAQDGGSAAPPEVFRGAASALVASVEVDRDALLPIGEVFRFAALDGSSVYETDLQTARASLFFPGNGLIQGPNLLCGTFGGSFPPEFAPILEACTRYDYPLSVVADSTTPRKSTAGAAALGAPADPVSADAVSANATAGPDGSSSTALMEDLRVLGLPAIGAVTLLPIEQLQVDPTLVAIESATSRTTQQIEQGTLVVRSEAVLAGVKLVGGLVDIGSIRSRSTATDDAAGHRTADASIEVSGVEVGGLPAQVTEEGLVLGAASGGPLQQQLQSLLNQLLQGLGVEVRLLETQEDPDDGQGQSVASASGLLLDFAIDAQGLATIPGPIGDIDLNGTYVGSIQLGSTGAAAGATSFDDPPLPATDIGGVDPGDGSGDIDGGFDPGPLEGPAPAVEEAAPAPVDVPEVPDLLRRIVDPFGGRLGLIYLSFTFAVLGLCVAPRFAVPSRLPGARP